MEALPDGSVAVLRAGKIKYMSKNILYVCMFTPWIHISHEVIQLSLSPGVRFLVFDRFRGGFCGCYSGFVSSYGNYPILCTSQKRTILPKATG